MEKLATPVQNFYKDTNVLITGATGFLGQILIEKLLRSTGVNTVFLLVREKKGKDMQVRIDELFDDVAFSRLKKECPNFRQRVIGINGDCSLADLGLSNTDREKIISVVNIIFHGAATVRFEEHIKLAYNINVNGTKSIIHLARHMTKLKSIVHVSTAFSNCIREGKIEEKIYDCPIYYTDVSKLIEKYSETELEKLTPRIIGKWPNTYSFTKALAESLIKDIGKGLPITVFRPSIVTSTYKEPLEGWINNLYGYSGVYGALMSGLLRVSLCDLKQNADIIPVDTCVAGLIAVAWDSSERFENSEDIMVYNHVTSPENHITWEESVNLNNIYLKEYPLLYYLWVPHMFITKYFPVFWILTILLHGVPALIMDFIALISGNKPTMLKKYRLIYKFSISIFYFNSKSWKFSNENISNLWKKLNLDDKELFPMSVTTINWLVFLRNYIKGLRIYLLKDPDSTLEKAKRKDKWIRFINRILKYVFALLTFNFIIKITLNFVV